jgi:hypothetical protein
MLSFISYQIDTTDIKKGEIALRALGSALSKLDRKRRPIEVEKFRANATRKMSNLVLEFTIRLANLAYENTPMGDDDRIYAGAKAGATDADRQYTRLYANRLAQYGIPMEAGYHAGAYVYSKSKIPALVPEIKDKPEMLADIKRAFNASYKAGDVFYLAAKGPAYKYFINGEIADSSVIPNINTIMQAYRSISQASMSLKV